MSTEQAYSPLSLPQVQTAAQSRRDEQSAAKGHALGFAAGLRAAAAETAELRARVAREHDEALAEGRARVDAAVASLESAVRALRERAIPTLDSAEAAIIDAALGLAESIVGVELAASDSAALAALARVTAHPDSGSAIGVRMHPDDIAAIPADVSAGIPLVGDRTLCRGDAVADFIDGFLDARIESAVTRMRAALREEDAG